MAGGPGGARHGVARHGHHHGRARPALDVHRPRAPLAEGDCALAAVVGLGSGLVLFGATRVFVAIAASWERSGGHTAELYGNESNVSLRSRCWWPGPLRAGGGAVLARAGGRPVREATGSLLAGAAIALGGYVAVCAFSRNIPVIAGALVGGGLWSRCSCGPAACWRPVLARRVHRTHDPCPAARGDRRRRPGRPFRVTLRPLPPQVADVFDRGSVAYVAVPTRAGPHVTPRRVRDVRLADVADHGAADREGRATGRPGPRAAGLVRAGDHSVSFVGSVRLHDMLRPARGRAP